MAESYVDPSVSALFVSLTVPDRDFVNLQADASERSPGVKQRLASYAWSVEPGKLTHEWAHVLQIAAYPLLHLRAARRALMAIAKVRLLRGEEPIALPMRWSLDPRWRDGNLIETESIRLIVDGDKFSLQPVADNSRRGSLRELDLIEEDATIFQYRVETGSRGTGPGYRRWLLEGRRYCALFYYLADLMTDDQALNLIPVLTRVAFSTVRPLESFGNIIACLLRDGTEVMVPEFPDEDWDFFMEEFFTGYLHKIHGDVNEVSMNPVENALDSQQGVFTSKQFQLAIGRTPYLAASQLAKWSADDNGIIHDILRTPWLYFERGGQEWKSSLNKYLPPILAYNFKAADSGGQQGILHMSDAILGAPLITFATEPPKTFAIGSLIYETFRSKQLYDAQFGVRKPLATCPHRKCAFNSKALCEGWLPIPQAAIDCEFPKWLAASTKRTVSHDGATLVSIERRTDD